MKRVLVAALLAVGMLLGSAVPASAATVSTQSKTLLKKSGYVYKYLYGSFDEYDSYDWTSKRLHVSKNKRIKVKYTVDCLEPWWNYPRGDGSMLVTWTPGTNPYSLNYSYGYASGQESGTITFKAKSSVGYIGVYSGSDNCHFKLTVTQ